MESYSTEHHKSIKSIFIEAIHIYKRNNYDVITGLNPYHFSGRGALMLPFTCITRNNDLEILSTWGGYCTSRSIYDRKFVLYI